jgi:hypothetical protein
MSYPFVVLMIATTIIVVVALRVLRRMIGLPILSFGLKRERNKSSITSEMTKDSN